MFERKPEKTIEHDAKLEENVGAFNQSASLERLPTMQ